MRVAFIGQKGIPAVSGGVEKHVEKLATHLAARGQEVFVYVRDHYTDPALTEFQGVTLIHIPSIRTKHLDALSHSLFATLHALFQPYDVIHYQSIGPSVWSIIPRLLKPSAKVVATFHSRDYFHRKWGWFAQLCLRAAEYATCTVPKKTIVSTGTYVEYVRRTYGRDAVFIPNGAAVAFEPDTAALNRWSLRPRRYILVVSRLVAHKGIHYLIKAFKELEDTNRLPNNFKLVIVGAHANTEEYERYLKVISEGRGNIVFAGEQSGQAMETLYSHGFLFVQPSEEEGLPLALLEAMGHGLFPIVSDIPSMREAVAETGAHFIPKDVEGLKRELAYYLSRPSEVERLGCLARERIRERYGWEAITGRTVQVYADVLKQQSLKKHEYVR